MAEEIGVDARHDSRPDLITALRRARGRSAGEDVEDEIEGLSELLWALHKTGDRRRIAQVADRLVQTAAGIDQQLGSATSLLVEVVQTLAGVGRIDLAEQFIATIRHPWDQDDARRNLVAMLAGAGEFQRAERTVGAIGEADARSDALLGLVPSLTEAGDRPGALRVARQAEESIAAVHDVNDRVRKLNHLVQVLMAGEHPDEARRVADRAEETAVAVTDPHDRDWTHFSAVHALTVAGQFDRAERLIAGIIDRSPRETALFKLSVGLGAAGDFDRGLLVAGRITSPDTRATAQGQHVLLMAEAGDFERARSTASGIAVPSARADALGDLAGVMAAAGDRAGSRSIARQADQVAGDIEYPATRSLVRSRLVDELVDAGDLEQAEVTALIPVDGHDRSSDLRRVARAMAEAGDPAGARRILTRAEPLAHSLTEPDRRAWALSALAEDFFAAGAADDAVRLLVETTETGPWYRALAAAAVIAPDAVQDLADDIRTEQP